ncbi:DegT/DnrJ/EryC1/StrS family aminotransferase, partial [Klebsiella michiganensis]|uniref:DegT/DnrJ/EryC1/StrS family aminotransferase n=1 Tax=Klebsiella michiganensis TaxID=1134687 RepID=UPI001D0DD505
MAKTVLATVRKVVGVTGQLPLHEPEFAGHEWSYVKECLDTGWVSSVGSYVDRFERDLAAYT